jgi:hypothetical protein
MIRDFEEWTAPMAEVARMSTLSGATIGIEASDYLDQLDKFHVPVAAHPLVVKEPLTPALGGTPFGLKPIFRATIAAWRAQGITPLFVFSGLNVGKSDTALAEALRNTQTHSDAWALYDKNDPSNAVDTFRKSTAVAPESLFRLLQTILREEGVEFIVAPYGAPAQVCSEAAVDLSNHLSYHTSTNPRPSTPRPAPRKSFSSTCRRSSLRGTLNRATSPGSDVKAALRT